MTVEACYTIVAPEDSLESIPINELRTALEKGSEETKIETMKKVLNLMANGHSCDQLLMTCIRFVMPTQKNKLLKKLLLAFFEGCEKLNPDGKLKQEMILVCNALRNDLQHPNEFVRGTTLRFLCKLKEAELIEPLVPSVQNCLENRHFYVRKNAVFAISSIYKSFEYLIPNAPEMLFKSLLIENEPSCRKNCLLALIDISLHKAVEYFYLVCDRLEELDFNMHLAVIELMRKDLVFGIGDKGKYIKTALFLMSTNSGMVKYEAAYTLLSLTSTQSAVRAVAQCFVDLAAKESDNNVKLIALYRLNELKDKYPANMDDMVMSLLPVLSSSDNDVNKKCLDIIQSLLTLRYAEEVVFFIKRELVRLNNESDGLDKNQDYKKLLLNSLSVCLKKFPDTMKTVVDCFIDLVDDSNVSAAVDALHHIREAILVFPEIRQKIINSLSQKLPSLFSIKLCRGILWIIGNFAMESDEINLCFEKIKESLGPLPFELAKEETVEEEAPKTVTRTRILADGTYATETSLGTNAGSSKEKKYSIKRNFFIGALLSACLVKLISHLQERNVDQKILNNLKAQAMLMMCNIIKLGESSLPSTKIDSDSYESILTSIRVIGYSKQRVLKKFLDQSLSEFDKAFDQKSSIEEPRGLLNEKVLLTKFDQGLSFRFIQDHSKETKDEYSLDIAKAIGSDFDSQISKSRLDTIVQLTGFSDPVYAEAFVESEKHDAIIDILLVNQTSETLRNLTMELYATGGLKAVTKPSQYNVGPHGFQIMKASFKMSETGDGVIYGTITYDGTSAADSFIINMREIRFDVLQMIKPSNISDTEFRNKWVILEWENKINIETSHKDLRTFLKVLMDALKMNCINVEPRLEGSDNITFLVANLAGATAGGQDVLMNVCIRKDETDKISGHCRIRSQLQGIVYALGEKVTSCQQND